MDRPRDAPPARVTRTAAGGGFLATPPDPAGTRALGVTGVTGIARPARWVAVVTATAPALPGDALEFVVLDDGTIVVAAAVPDGSLTPLADAVEHVVAPPYSAEATRQDGDLWAVGANPVAIAELPAGLEGGVIEQAAYGRETSCSIDGASCDPFPQLAELGRRRGVDYTLRADRLDATTWVVRVEVL
jgi:hypothetical protein